MDKFKTSGSVHNRKHEVLCLLSEMNQFKLLFKDILVTNCHPIQQSIRQVARASGVSTTSASRFLQALKLNPFKITLVQELN